MCGDGATQNHVGPNALVRARELSSPQTQLSYQGIALAMSQIPRESDAPFRGWVANP